MIAEVTEEYALKVIDGPVELTGTHFLKRALIVALGTFSVVVEPGRHCDSSHQKIEIFHK